LSLLALANFMRLSLMKAAHAGVGGAPCRKSGYVGRKRWAQPNDRFSLPQRLKSLRGNDNKLLALYQGTTSVVPQREQKESGF